MVSALLQQPPCCVIGRKQKDTTVWAKEESSARSIPYGASKRSPRSHLRYPPTHRTRSANRLAHAPVSLSACVSAYRYEPVVPPSPVPDPWNSTAWIFTQLTELTSPPCSVSVPPSLESNWHLSGSVASWLSSPAKDPPLCPTTLSCYRGPSGQQRRGDQGDP